MVMAKERSPGILDNQQPETIGVRTKIFEILSNRPGKLVTWQEFIHQIPHFSLRQIKKGVKPISHQVCNAWLNLHLFFQEISIPILILFW